MKYQLTWKQVWELAEGLDVEIVIPAPLEMDLPANLKAWVMDNLDDEFHEHLQFTTIDEVICVPYENSIGRIVERWDNHQMCFCVPVVRARLKNMSVAQEGAEDRSLFEQSINWPHIETEMEKSA